VGVQHAHQKAVIHRDLKPSNVLVSIQDGKAIPKIIDFGVAKATSQPLTDKTLHTQLGVMIGTPDYMSPEQAELTGQDIDTRTDVYSLGVMLYELLTGALPFDPKELRKAGLEGIRKKIVETEPPKPSARLTTLGEQSTQSAQRRSTEPPALRRQLRGDLDWITMKALEKDRTRRYGSPFELSADIGRYLTDEPVLATPPSAAYRAKKFARRHKLGVGAAAAGLLVMIAFAATMAVQTQRIATERDNAERAREDLEAVVDFQAGMLSEIEPEQMGAWLADDLRTSMEAATRERGLTESEIAIVFDSYDASMRRVNFTNTALDVIDRNILARAVETLEERFADQPLIDARLRGTIGVTYKELGLYQAAEPELLRAVETRKRLLGDDHRDTLSSMYSLGCLYYSQGRNDEAEDIYVETLETQKRVLGDDHPDTLWTMNSRALVYADRGREDEAEALYLEALETRKRVLGDDHPDTLWSMNSLGALYNSQGRYAEAEPLYRETLETRKRVLGEDHPDTLWSMNNLANLYRSQGRYAEAETLHVETLETRKRVLGDDHPSTLVSVNNLANLYVNQGRYDEAEPLFIETLETRKRVLGDDHPSTLASMNGLAWFLLTREPPASRDPERALALALEVAGKTGHENPAYLDTLSLAYHLTGDRAKAVANQKKALALLPDGPSPMRTELEKNLARFEAGLAGQK
jgi:non-specific serine/threonine protein kinase/serine/threonine-protein kinase